MVRQTEPMKIDKLKQRLSHLVFAQVSFTSAKDTEIISFRNQRGITVWNDDPYFEQDLKNARNSTVGLREVSYHFYYGFANDTDGWIHFDSKGHVHDDKDYAHLGILTEQHALTPPPNGTWIVGSVLNPSSKPHFCKWSRCTEEEKTFAEFLHSGKTRFSVHDLRQLNIRRMDDGRLNLRLGHIAKLILERDPDYFLDHRDRHLRPEIDEEIWDLCQEFEEPELWGQYTEKALELVRQRHDRDKYPQYYYSKWIPRPAPKPVEDCLNGRSSVGLSTPFERLSI